MRPFLEQVASHFMQAGDISGRCFIFPNRRSQVFFKKHLGEVVKASGKPIFAPKLLTINDFFYNIAGIGPSDRVSLLLELYDCYHALYPKAEPLDEFIFWGDVILGDFDDVDKYLVDPKQLFTNVKEYKEIQDSYSYLTDNQRSAIERFVSHFRDSGRLTVNLDSDKPNVKERFLQIWNILLPLYDSFRARLEGKGMSYEGMTYRSLVERLTSEPVADVLQSAFGDIKEYVFVGLNALNECEKAVMRKMRNAGLATFCWDYSSRMIKDPRNNASFFMSRNIEEFGQCFTPDPEGLPVPEIEVVSVPSSTAQAKLIPSLVKDEDHAIVLPDESLLVPVLNSIPPEIKDINVTMGYPMKGSSLFDFLNLISAMQMHLRQKDGCWYFYHAQVWPILSSGLFRKVTEGDQDASGISESVKKGAKYYIPQNELNGHPFFDLVFRPVVSDPKTASRQQTADFEEYLKSLITGLAGALATDPDMALEIEFGRRAYSAINQLSSKKLAILPATYSRLLSVVLGPMSVPFNGEPLKGLQIMGPLETRALDFKHLIILSCNEGIFPRRSVSSSFIPPELRKGFGLPTYDFQDAVWAYYFYRMIQRAKKVTLVYDSRTEGLKNGEESRFIKQLEYHYNIPVKRSFVKAEARVHGNLPDIPKTDGDIEKLLGVTLSASSLKSYLDCPAQFYFSKIACLNEESEVAEDLDSGMLGDVFHSTMQALYTGDGNMSEITKEYIASWLGRKAEIKQKVRSLVMEQLHTLEVSGRTLVLEDVIVQYVMKTLERDAEFMDKTGVPSFRILGLENKFEMTFDGFKLVGYVDRMDSFLPGEVRIVDYKTGKVEDNDVSITDANAARIADLLFGEDNQKRPKIAFQMFLYDTMVSRDPRYRDTFLVNSIYQPARFFTEGVRNVPSSRVFNEEVESRLHGLLSDMKDTSKGWSRTKDKDTCKWCAFKMICGR